jgi:hypothetical protein
MLLRMHTRQTKTSSIFGASDFEEILTKKKTKKVKKGLLTIREKKTVKSKLVWWRTRLRDREEEGIKTLNAERGDWLECLDIEETWGWQRRKETWAAAREKMWAADEKKKKDKETRSGMGDGFSLFFVVLFCF